MNEAYAIDEKLQAAQDQVKNFNVRDNALGFPSTEYTLLDKIKEDYEPYRKLWTMSHDFITFTKDWLCGSFTVSYQMVFALLCCLVAGRPHC